MTIESLTAEVEAAPESHRTLSERAFSDLREAIVTGSLQPGERLRIADLARTLDLSALPVRDALKRLHAAGLVESTPHRGAWVTELSSEDLIDLYENRLALETLAIEQAARRFTALDAALARRALAAHRVAAAADDVERIRLTHADFHFCLYRASGSSWLPRLIRPLWQSGDRYLLALGLQGSLANRIDEQRRILRACIHHQPSEAARALRANLIATVRAIAAAMGQAQSVELSDPSALASQLAARETSRVNPPRVEDERSCRVARRRRAPGPAGSAMAP